MSRYIDLHSHVLAGLDDGPGEIEHSVALVRDMHDLGYETIVATPHLKHGSWEPSEEEMAQAAVALRRALENDGLPVTILSGAEHNADGLFFNRLEGGRLKTLGEASKAVLVEFPAALSTSVKLEMLFQLKVKGLTPIMAHPERALSAQSLRDLLKRWCEQGGLTQINLGSLVGQFGRRPKSLSRELVEEGLVQVAASDAHQPEEVMKFIRKGIKFLRRYGEEYADELLRDNPRAILEGTFVSKEYGEQ